MTKKINLLQIIPRMDVGGAETGCLHVAEYLARIGHKSFILTSGGNLLNLIDRDKIGILNWPVSKNFFMIIFNIFVILFLILLKRINICHVRSRGPAWSAYFACKLTNVPLVSTFHGTYNFKSNTKLFYNSVMLRTNHVIAGSDYILNHIYKNYKTEKKISVIKRGIDTDYFSNKNVSETEENKLKEFLQIPKDKFLILLPGRLTYWKGQKLFIEAINFLKTSNKFKNCFALIVGSDQGRKKYKDELINMVKKYNLQDTLKIAHGINKMPVAYSISNLIVSSSIEPEAFGRVSVEAQSMEKPILASNLGGSTETIVPEKTGWLFRSESVSELANSIEMITKLDKKVLDAIGRQGRKNVLNNYSKDRMCSKTLEIYNSLV